MLKKIFSKFFGKFENREEVKKYALLGIIFGLLIATYWGLRPLKDGIFFGIVGADYQPIAKYFCKYEANAWTEGGPHWRINRWTGCVYT